MVMKKKLPFHELIMSQVSEQVNAIIRLWSDSWSSGYDKERLKIEFVHHLKQLRSGHIPLGARKGLSDRLLECSTRVKCFSSDMGELLVSASNAIHPDNYCDEIEVTD